MAAPRICDTEAYLIEDIMLLIGLRISVFDLPRFILTSRWVAKHAEKFWRHHTMRIFEHPPRIFPPEINAISRPLTWHGLFFKRYNSRYVPWQIRHLRRPALKIMEEDIDNLIAEHCSVGQQYATAFIERKSFTIKDIFDQTESGEPSLFQLAHAATETAKLKLLDFFHKKLVLPNVAIKSFDKQIDLPQATQALLREALDQPKLTFEQLATLGEQLLTALIGADKHAAKCKGSHLHFLQVRHNL